MSAQQIYAAENDKEQIVRGIISQWQVSAVGHVSDTKPDDVLRLSGKKKPWKVRKLTNLNNKYQSNGSHLVKTGTNWTLSPDKKKPDRLFSGTRHCRIVASLTPASLQPLTAGRHGGNCLPLPQGLCPLLRAGQNGARPMGLPPRGHRGAQDTPCQRLGGVARLLLLQLMFRDEQKHREAGL